MSDFATSWALSRKRFVDEISELSSDQLNWRLHKGSLTIGEMALHVAGTEISFGSQLSGLDLDEQGERLRLAATQGVVDDLPFPFASEEIDLQVVLDSLEYAQRLWQPLITEASATIRQREIKSVLGPMISGEGAFARLAFHSAYHQGQTYLIKTAPGFPNS